MADGMDAPSIDGVVLVSKTFATYDEALHDGAIHLQVTSSASLLLDNDFRPGVCKDTAADWDYEMILVGVANGKAHVAGYECRDGDFVLGGVH